MSAAAHGSVGEALPWSSQQGGLAASANDVERAEDCAALLGAAGLPGAVPGAASAQALNAEVSDDLLCQRVSDIGQAPKASLIQVQIGLAAKKCAEAGFVDLEKGVQDANGSDTGSDETADFLAGFAVDSRFNPDKDV